MLRPLTALASLILLTGVALASAEITITTPSQEQVVGPSTPIRGRVSERAFLVIYTEVFRADGEKIGTVPGIRHWSNDDNTISVRIATPRLFALPEERLRYDIYVKAYSSPERTGEAPDLGQVVITVYSQ